MTPTELRRKGFEALVDALGPVDAVRFIQQYDSGEGDYTQDRNQWLDPLTLADFHQYVNGKSDSGEA